MVELVNTTRDVHILPFMRRVERPGGLPPLNLVDRGRSLVIGDAADATLPPGVERNKRCPSPVVVLSLEEYNALGKANIAFLEAAIKAGRIRRRDYNS